MCRHQFEYDINLLKEKRLRTSDNIMTESFSTNESKINTLGKFLQTNYEDQIKFDNFVPKSCSTLDSIKYSNSN